jgi:hypothetical protein
MTGFEIAYTNKVIRVSVKDEENSALLVENRIKNSLNKLSILY